MPAVMAIQLEGITLWSPSRSTGAGRILQAPGGRSAFFPEREPVHTRCRVPARDSVSQIAKNCEEEARMRALIKVGWTIAIGIALAWPLLFWGKPALPDNEHTERVRPHYNLLERHDILW
jgi:hypothetical protein